jgi:cytochrome c biogenesis protein CcmG, thiol:disulfide interchange protein DsbE
MRRLRWLLVPIVVVPLGWLFFAGFGLDPRAVASPLIGQPAPEWTYATLGGGQMSSDDLAGRPYLVNFWASWCDPCVDEHPILSSAWDAHGDEIAIVGVLYNDSSDNARAFLDRYGRAGYPTVLDESGRMAVDFGVIGPPETFFVDADGIVRDKQTGPLTEALMDDRLASIGVDR